MVTAAVDTAVSDRLQLAGFHLSRETVKSMIDSAILPPGLGQWNTSSMTCLEPTKTTGAPCQRHTIGPCWQHAAAAAPAAVPAQGAPSTQTMTAAAAQAGPAPDPSGAATPTPVSSTSIAPPAAAHQPPSRFRLIRDLVPEDEVNQFSELVVGWLIDPHSTLDTLAGDIVSALPEPHKRNLDHVLCVLISGVKKGLSVETYIGTLTDLLSRALQQAGMPRVWAAASAGGAVALAKAAFGHLNSEQLQLTLSCLALIVCPDPDRCPDQSTNFAPFTTEGVATALEGLVPLDVLTELRIKR